MNTHFDFIAKNKEFTFLSGIKNKTFLLLLIVLKFKGHNGKATQNTTIFSERRG